LQQFRVVRQKLLDRWLDQNLHCYAAPDGGKLELSVFGLGNTRAQLGRKEMDRVGQLMFRYFPQIA
jgi:hypothetical protein